MPIVRHNPPELFPQYRCYSHATEIRGESRLLVISGLNGYLADGKTMPESFEEQAEVIWSHLAAILRSADMTFANLVSLRFYLANPRYDEANVQMRAKHLGSHQPSLTVICCQLLDPRWKLEVEAMAATRAGSRVPVPADSRRLRRGQLCAYDFDPQLEPEDADGALEGQERQRRRGRVEQAIEGRSAGPHPAGHVGLRELLIGHCLGELEGENTLRRHGFRGLEQAFFGEEVVEARAQVVWIHGYLQDWRRVYHCWYETGTRGRQATAGNNRPRSSSISSKGGTRAFCSALQAPSWTQRCASRKYASRVRSRGSASQK